MLNMEHWEKEGGFWGDGDCVTVTRGAARLPSGG